MNYTVTITPTHDATPTPEDDYAMLSAIAEDVASPYLILVRSEEGVHSAENCSDGEGGACHLGALADLADAAAAVAFNEIKAAFGYQVAAKFLSDLTASCL